MRSALLSRELIQELNPGKKSRLRQKATRWGSHLARPCHFRANELCGFPEIFCHKGRTCIHSFRKLTNLTFPTAYENGPATRAESCQQIRDPVPDHVAFVQRHLQVGGRLLEQTDLRFAAAAALPELGYFCFRMMQAVVD